MAYYDNPLFSDLKIKLKSGKLLNARRIILYESDSRFFKGLLNAPGSFTENNTNVIGFPDYDDSVVEFVISIIYERDLYKIYKPGNTMRKFMTISSDM